MKTTGVARPVARSNKWTAAVLLSVSALVVAWLSGGSTVDRARLAMLVLALGSAQVLDDPMTELVHASPTRFGVVRTWRLAFGTVPLALGWAVLLVALPLDGVRPALTLELVAVTCWVLALSAVVARLTRDAEGGPEAAAAVCALMAGSTFLPPRWTLTVAELGDPRWAASHQRWAALLVVAVAVLAVTTIDPLNRLSPMRALGGRQPRPRRS